MPGLSEPRLDKLKCESETVRTLNKYLEVLNGIWDGVRNEEESVEKPSCFSSLGLTWTSCLVSGYMYLGFAPVHNYNAN